MGLPYEAARSQEEFTRKFPQPDQICRDSRINHSRDLSHGQLPDLRWGCNLRHTRESEVLEGISSLFYPQLRDILGVPANPRAS